MSVSTYQINIGWLYPEYMSTYGDRGNIIVLKRRCDWRNIKTEIIPIEIDTKKETLIKCDIVIGGGAQDRQQVLVAKDLLENKKKTLKKMFNDGIPGLFVCGSPQLLGHYYMTGDGTKLEGLGIFDFVTKHFGKDKPRCIGNTCSKINSKFQIPNSKFKETLVGFENHGGRTYLGKNATPFARVIKGFGNNGEDGWEGSLYKNVIACYYHGPLLSKNPHIADWLIIKALNIKYKADIKLRELDDVLEWKAHEFILKKMGL